MFIEIGFWYGYGPEGMAAVSNHGYEGMAINSAISWQTWLTATDNGYRVLFSCYCYQVESGP